MDYQAMNIHQLTNASPAETNLGGCGLIATASALADAGHKVMLMSPVWPPRADRSLGFDRRFFGGRASTNAPPDIVHAHEPFLSGEHALLLAEKLDAPLVFTAGRHYDSPLALTLAENAALRAFIAKLGVCFANLCDAVIAPGQDLAGQLLEQGVTTPIHVAAEAVAAAPSARAARLIEIYGETRRRREALRQKAVRQTARLHHELMHAWSCARPAAWDRSVGETLRHALADAASP